MERPDSACPVATARPSTSRERATRRGWMWLAPLLPATVSCHEKQRRALSDVTSADACPGNRCSRLETFRMGQCSQVWPTGRAPRPGPECAPPSSSTASLAYCRVRELVYRTLTRPATSGQPRARAVGPGPGRGRSSDSVSALSTLGASRAIGVRRQAGSPKHRALPGTRWHAARRAHRHLHSPLRSLWRLGCRSRHTC